MIRKFLGFCLSVLLCAGLLACSFDLLPDEFRRVTLRGNEKTVQLPLTYDPTEGLTFVVDMRFDDGGDNPITVTAPASVGEGAQPIPTVTVTYPADLEDYGFSIVTEGNTLTVSADEKVRFDTDAFRVVLCADVKAYDLTGAFSLRADHAGMQTDTLALSVVGGAECEIGNVAADAVTMHVDGAADIVMTGETDALVGVINGAADIACDALHAQTADITINGIGAAEVYADAHLRVEINGAGSVRYNGDPTVEKTVNGAGAVKRRTPKETSHSQTDTH